VICIDARHIKAVANHTFVPADARANEQSVRAKSVLPFNTGHSFRASARPKCAKRRHRAWGLFSNSGAANRGDLFGSFVFDLCISDCQSHALSRLIGSIFFPSVESGLQQDDIVASCNPQCECGLG